MLFFLTNKSLFYSFKMKAAHEKLGRPCDMCANYEAQLVLSQTTMLSAVSAKDASEKAMNDAVERLEKEKTMRYTFGFS